MIVENLNNEILVRFSSDYDMSRIQTILDYLRYEELTSGSTATEKDVEMLVKRVKKGRWGKISKDLGIND